jgi:ATP-dependent DNA ligase
LAFLEDGKCRLMSRNGNQFKSFENLSQALPKEVLSLSAVVDGEIACLDHTGRPKFADLFYRRSEPVFVAFDLLSANEEDQRRLPLIERKAQLQQRSASATL